MRHIVQIEPTNRCTRKCHYCGHMNMTRDKGLMSMETFQNALALCVEFEQTEVGLNHYGESLLHPQIVEMAVECNRVGISPWLYTNGDLLTDLMIRGLSVVRWSGFTISFHAPLERRIELFMKCQASGIPAHYQAGNGENALSIAGQVPFENPSDAGQPPLADPMNHCRFLRDEMGIVLWDGRLVPCCFDYDAKGTFGSVNHPGALKQRPTVFPVCAKCPGHPANIV